VISEYDFTVVGSPGRVVAAYEFVLGVETRIDVTPRFAADTRVTVADAAVPVAGVNVIVSTNEVVDVEASVYVNVKSPLASVTRVLNTSAELRPEIDGVIVTFDAPAPKLSTKLPFRVTAAPTPALSTDCVIVIAPLVAAVAVFTYEVPAGAEPAVVVAA
jgi:hypothetical protein